MAGDEDDDADLFRRAAGGVRRMQSNRVYHEPRRPRPVPRPGTDTGAAPTDMFSDADVAPPAAGTLLYCGSGVQKKTLRRLRRGQIRIEDELDLHGMRVHEATEALATFLAESRARGLRCVRIIHGKGFGSDAGRSVLKEKVARWLRLRDEVAAYVSARPGDGGTGALYVLLKR